MAAQPVTVSAKAADSTHSSELDLKDAVPVNAVPSSEADRLENPFEDPNVAQHYRDLYEQAQYECRHAFDPDLTWSPQEERKLVRKLDWHVCLWACIMFFALQVDRGNLAQAVSDNMLDQLNLSTNDYNYGRSCKTNLTPKSALTSTGNTIFRVSFLLAELPSQLVSKKLGPDR